MTIPRISVMILTADTPKRTNHFLLLKQRKCLTLLVIQRTRVAHPRVINPWGSRILEEQMFLEHLVFYIITQARIYKSFSFLCLDPAGTYSWSFKEPGLFKISGMVTHCYEKVDHVLWLFSPSNVFDVCLTTFVVFKKNSWFNRALRVFLKVKMPGTTKITAFTLKQWRVVSLFFTRPAIPAITC